MASLTGRTTFKWLRFYIHDSGATLRSIPIDSLSVVGLKYDELELSAWQDAVKGRLPTMPDAPIEIGGPFDTLPVDSVPTLSGSHTVLNGVHGLCVPLTIDIRFGIRAATESDSPQFGITASAVNGYIVTSYEVDIKAGTYKARAVLVPGSIAPAFGVDAEV